MTIELIARAAAYEMREAVVAGGSFTYADLLAASGRAASGLLAGAADLRGQRVAFLVPPGFDYVATQWGIWRAGGIAVPLAVSHPRHELAYVIADSDAGTVVAHPDFEERVRPLLAQEGIRFARTTGPLSAEAGMLPDVDESRRAMILYTSGTTGKPKGVVTTHGQIRAQVTSLVDAWEWTPGDRILLVLPLHHVHGIVNVLTCALWTGGCCEMLTRFDAHETWRRFLSRPLTVFMAVPTVYQRLIAAWEEVSPQQQEAMSEVCRRMRLMVSGSSALPVSVFERWREITGHTLLERYGMTEIGMGLSNPVHGERVPGLVGGPLPGVEVRLVDDEMHDVPSGSPGEVLVRGPGVFHEYWRQPQATAEAFHDGWFRTGDVAVVEGGRYRILGRRSIDIIKTGGYKVSALEIEEVLRDHPSLRDCSVVGVPDAEWGERVCVAAELKEGASLSLEELRRWAGERLAPYKVPRSLETVSSLPRNPMGKVVKPDVAALFVVDDGRFPQRTYLRR